MLPSTTVRGTHCFGISPHFDVAPTGHLLVRTLAPPTARGRVVAQTFRADSLAQGIDPQSSRERSIAAVDASGRLLWCRIEPESSALSPDGEELAYTSKRDLVQVRLSDGTPTLRRLPFEPKGLIYDDAGDAIYLHDGQAVYQASRREDTSPMLVFREVVDTLVLANDAMVVFRSSFDFATYDRTWGCVRQWMRSRLGSAADIELRRAGSSILAFSVGRDDVELHDPWWGGCRTRQLETVYDASSDGELLRVLVGDSKRVLQTWRDDQLVESVDADVPSVWHAETAVAGPVASARCEVAWYDDHPCLFVGQRLRATKTIEEGSTIVAVAQIGADVYVATRHLIAAHAMRRRDHRRTLAPVHDEPITALTVCAGHLVSVSANGKAFVRSPAGETLCELPHPSAIWDVDSHDGRLATVGDEGVLRVYRDVLASNTFDSFRVGVCHAVATSPNLVAVASREAVSMLSWSGEPRWSARGHIANIVAHPTEDLFAMSTSTGEVLLVRPDEQREISVGHAPSPTLAFRRDGTRLLIGSGTPTHPGSALELELS